MTDRELLELAVKLNLSIEFEVLPEGPIVRVSVPWNDDFAGYSWNEWLLKDADAATRRAITRAAAAMAGDAK